MVFSYCALEKLRNSNSTISLCLNILTGLTGCPRRSDHGRDCSPLWNPSPSPAAPLLGFQECACLFKNLHASPHPGVAKSQLAEAHIKARAA
jgi:hypothetical protein